MTHRTGSDVLSRRAALRDGACALAAVAAAPLVAACSDDDSRNRGEAVPCAPSANDAGNAVPSRPFDGGVVLPASVAGIAIPDSALARAAATLAFSVSPQVLYNHVLRTYVFAALLFERKGTAYDAELAFVGSALHDLGLLDAFMSPGERFELDGADAAMKFLTEWNVPAARADIVWDAIALHTNSSIAARKAPEIAMVSLGAAMDAAGLNLDQLSPESVEQVLDSFPRIGFKQASVQTMIALCEKKPFGQLMHPFAEVGRRHIPNFVCPTVEDLMLAAPFDE